MGVAKESDMTGQLNSSPTGILLSGASDLRLGVGTTPAQPRTML